MYLAGRNKFRCEGAEPDANTPQSLEYGSTLYKLSSTYSSISVQVLDTVRSSPYLTWVTDAPQHGNGESRPLLQGCIPYLTYVSAKATMIGSSPILSFLPSLISTPANYKSDEIDNGLAWRKGEAHGRYVRRYFVQDEYLTYSVRGEDQHCRRCVFNAPGGPNALSTALWRDVDHDIHLALATGLHSQSQVPKYVSRQTIGA